MLETSLDTMSPGEHAIIDRINNATATIHQRLLEMGLIKGTKVQVIRFAPMGDPIEIKVRGSRLTLRRLEAATVIVKKEQQ